MIDKIREEALRSLEKIREGYGFFTPEHCDISYQKHVGYAVEIGLIDQEDFHLAIIRGTRKRAKRVLDIVNSGWGVFTNNIHSNQTFKQELRELVNRGYVDQEDFHLTIAKWG